MAAPNTGILQQAVTCSVCLELVDDTNKRSTARLICGHQFHLDCIGSAFNAKGSMQCPNCRRVEDGKWLYANGRWPPHPHPEIPRPEDEEAYEVEYEMFAQVAEVISPEDWIMHNRWCPYQGSFTEVSMLVGYGDPHPITRAGLGRLGGGETSQPGPFAPRLSSASNSHALGVEESAHPRRAAPPRTAVPSSGQWNHQSPADFQPVGVVGGIGLQGRLYVSQSAGHAPPLQQRHQRGQRQGVPTATPSTGHATSSQFGPIPSGWGNLGASANQNATREAELPMNNAQPRTNRQRRRTARQHSAAEGPRWLSRFLSRMNAIPGSSIQEGEPSHPQEGPVNTQSFHPYTFADDAERNHILRPSYPPGFH